MSLESKHIKISFKLMYQEGDKKMPVKNSKENIDIMNKYIKTKMWKEFIRYNCDDLRPFISPFYEPEVYHMTDVTTTVSHYYSIMVIIIEGKLKKYTYDEVFDMYKKSDALNKTWSKKVKSILKIEHIQALMEEGFWKMTCEGEMKIPKIGYMKVGDVKVKI